MKRIVICVVLITLSILLTGCKNNLEEGLIYIDCNGESSTIRTKENKRFKCKLVGIDYEFTIISVKDDKVVIKTSKYGLAKVQDNGGISLRTSENKFTLIKDKELVLCTQTTDYGESLKLVVK